MTRLVAASLLALTACGGAPADPVDAGLDAGLPDAGSADAGAEGPPGPWATRVVAFTPGSGAGFGQAKLPGVVLGPPQGQGDSSGSLDVLSLGFEGSIVLELGVEVVDGPGVDLLVFENPFIGFVETGVVAVSLDGGDWHEWPCAATVDGGTEGCAGLSPVYSNPGNGISPTDPARAGGDGFDLAALGLARARYVRVRDSGANHGYLPPSGGFDLDAVSVVHAAP